MKGSSFGFDASSPSTLFLGDAWLKERGSFVLSASGDNIMLYCTKDDDTNQFLFAALYQSDWSKENSDQSSFTTHESARPGELPDNCTISLVDKKKNWWYQGTQQGTKQELLNSIPNANN